MVPLCRHFAAGYFRFRPVVKRSSRLIAHTVEPRMSPFCRPMSAFGVEAEIPVTRADVGKPPETEFVQESAHAHSALVFKDVNSAAFFIIRMRLVIRIAG
jgi:hypothetical protein